MKITLTSKEEISVVANTLQERDALLDVLGIDITDERYLPFLTGTVSALIDTASQDATRGGGGFARLSVTTDYLTPYWELAKIRLGCDPFDLDLISRYRVINHRDYMEELRFVAKDNLVHATGVLQVFPYSGETFANEAEFVERGKTQLKQHIDDFLGKTVVEPEFLPLSNGLFKQNPRRSRIQYPAKETYNEKVWLLLVDEWTQKFASDAQKRLIARSAGKSHRQEIPWNNLTSSDKGGFHIDGYNGYVTWNEFQELR